MLLTAVAVAASALAITLPATGASSTTEVERGLPELESSERLEGPKIAEGTLRGSDGEPLSGTVVAYAQPTGAEQREKGKGETVPLVPVARAETGDDGTYALRADPSVNIDKVSKRGPDVDAIVDLRILGVADDGEEVAHFALPRSYDAEEGWGDLHTAEDDAEDEEPERRPANVDLDARPQNPSEARAKHNEVAGDRSASATGDSGDMDVASCTVLNGDLFDPVWALVGELNTSWNTTGSFNYQGGSTSELGIAVDAGGVWESSGTMSQSSSSSVSFPSASSSSNPRYDTQFQYREKTLVCPYYVEDFAEPDRWIGGSRVRYAPGPPTANHCTDYAAGSSVTVDKGTAINWTNGVKMGSQIGIDLSSRTGHDTSTSVTYDFSSSGELCGSNDYPFQAYRMASK